MLPKFSACGALCDPCPYFKGKKLPLCPGCKASEGNPFWGSCETYACAKEHGVEHCGLCEEFPCDDFMSRYDPNEGPENAVFRAGLLAYLTRHSNEKTVELLKNIEEKG
jgi:hypothetical protein